MKQSVSRLGVLLAIMLLSGCQGKSLVADNPVFSELPPRRSLVNTATNERSVASNSDRKSGNVELVSVSSSTDVLAGNTVVAEVNGRPLFVDDLVGSIRLTLEADERLSTEQRNQILTEQIKQRLDQRIEEEIILHALEAKVPEEQRENLKEHLETAFQNFLEARTEQLITEGKISSPEQMDQFLAAGGMSTGLLRETFFRIQMVNGFMESLTEDARRGSADRLELLKYYRENIVEFTPEERLRWQEIKVSIREHGRQQARQRMDEIIRLLQSGQQEFGAVAREYSDALTAEENGNRKWLSRGALRNKKLEAALFALPGGRMTEVFEDDNYLSIYRVARHEYATPRPFASVQAEIETSVKEQRVKEAREKVMKDLRAAASIRTIFDEAPGL